MNLEKNAVCKNVVNLYITLLVIYCNYYSNIADEEKEEMNERYDPSNAFLKNYKYDEKYKKNEEKSKSQPEETIAERVKLGRQKTNDEYLSDMSPLRDCKTSNFNFNCLKPLMPGGNKKATHT